MIFTSWGDLRDRVQDELDIADETFIDQNELLNYGRRAIDTAANIILTLYEDYFLTTTNLTLVSGQQTYSLPSDIYAQKIRRVLYNYAGSIYPVKRIKNLEETLFLVNTNYPYKYIITNSQANGFQINIYPTPTDTGAVLNIWYLRNVVQISQDSDIIDLPEAHQYIMAHIKDSCINKERGTVNAVPSAELKEQERLLIEALTCRAPDEDNIIEPDISFYQGVN